MLAETTDGNSQGISTSTAAIRNPRNPRCNASAVIIPRMNWLIDPTVTQISVFFSAIRIVWSSSMSR
jgi:hypothetical protein